jgi:hypothetical protein
MQSDDLPDRRFIFDDQRSPGGVRWRSHAGHYRQQRVIALPGIPDMQVSLRHAPGTRHANRRQCFSRGDWDVQGRNALTGANSQPGFVANQQ